MDEQFRSRVIGYGALVITVLIWSGWIVYTRQGVTHEMPLSVLILVRMLVPTVILAPLIWRTGIFVGVRPKLPLLLIICGRTTYSALGDWTHSSAIIRLCRFGAWHDADFCRGPRDSLVRREIGLVTHARTSLQFSGGPLAIAGHSLIAADLSANLGHLMFLIAGLNYAVFTLAFRKSGFTPIEAAGFISFWSLLIVFPFGLVPLIEHVRAGYVSEVIVQAVLQGLLSNLVALVTYSEGVRRLGTSKAAAFAALVPAGATLLAIPVLGEWPDMSTVAGVILSSFGVLLASGVLARGESRSE